MHIYWMLRVNLKRFLISWGDWFYGMYGELSPKTNGDRQFAKNLEILQWSMVLNTESWWLQVACKIPTSYRQAVPGQVSRMNFWISVTGSLYAAKPSWCEPLLFRRLGNHKDIQKGRFPEGWFNDSISFGRNYDSRPPGSWFLGIRLGWGTAKVGNLRHRNSQVVTVYWLYSSSGFVQNGGNGKPPNSHVYWNVSENGS